jgi:hypothetical protein
MRPDASFGSASSDLIASAAVCVCAPIGASLALYG